MNPYDTSLWEKELARKRQEREKMRRKMLAESLSKLKKYFRGKKEGSVYLAGSILRPGKFYDFSDIDIALEREPENPFEMTAELEQVIGRPVDLIALKHCRFRDQLLKCSKKII